MPKINSRILWAFTTKLGLTTAYWCHFSKTTLKALTPDTGLHHCMSLDVSSWMFHNFLKSNVSKTELFMFLPKPSLLIFFSLSTDKCTLLLSAILLVMQTCNPRIIFDSSLFLYPGSCQTVRLLLQDLQNSLLYSYCQNCSQSAISSCPACCLSTLQSIQYAATKGIFLGAASVILCPPHFQSLHLLFVSFCLKV